MWLPFLACLVLTGIHAYLGMHVIKRQVIFVDLALAQIAVLGASVGLLLGYEIDSAQGYWFSLTFTVIGAAIFAATRFKEQKIPQEAIIGIIYVVAASLMLIILSFSGEGTEHIRQSLIGNILLVRPAELMKIFVIYSVVGAIHFIFRHQFYLISDNAKEAFQKGVRVRKWDFFFYITFGLVVTSSVKLAGVLLVFSFLVIPAVCAMILSDHIKTRLLLGWTIGTIGSIIGITISYWFDLPTGASVVCAFGIILIGAAIVKTMIR
ncbi:MAG: metal ABC transporter permease [Candidatus Omnitrophica bacterium]|nr:metal ABC transporter permease [Candidatus Omnitrophota bacterium]